MLGSWCVVTTVLLARVGGNRDFAIQFQQLGGAKYDIFWDDGKDGSLVATMNPDDIISARSYEG